MGVDFVASSKSHGRHNPFCGNLFRNRAKIATAMLVGVFAMTLAAFATPAAADTCTYTIPSVTENVLVDFNLNPACGDGSDIASFPAPGDDAAEQSDTGKAIVHYGAAGTAFTYKAKVDAVGPDTFTLNITSGTHTGRIVTVTVQQIVGKPTITSLSPTSGAPTGGTTVVIAGTNLGGASAVTFGATAATGFTVNSSTQITATAPAGSGTVDVRVTTSVNDRVRSMSASPPPAEPARPAAADQYTYVGARR
jgi:hypothetical protein